MVNRWSTAHQSAGWNVVSHAALRSDDRSFANLAVSYHANLPRKNRFVANLS
jgi:enolase